MQLKSLAQILIVVMTVGSSPVYANTSKNSTVPTNSLRTSFVCNQDMKGIPTTYTRTQSRRIIKICLNSHWVRILTGLPSHYGFLRISLPQISTRKISLPRYNEH